MENLNKNSKPYLSGEYEEIFNASEMASMAAEDLAEYRNSLVDEMERESELEYAREENTMEIARRMRDNGFSDGDIMLATGLTEQQIRKL